MDLRGSAIALIVRHAHQPTYVSRFDSGTNGPIFKMQIDVGFPRLVSLPRIRMFVLADGERVNEEGE